MKYFDHALDVTIDFEPFLTLTHYFHLGVLMCKLYVTD